MALIQVRNIILHESTLKELTEISKFYRKDNLKFYTISDTTLNKLIPKLIRNYSKILKDIK